MALRKARSRMFTLGRFRNRRLAVCLSGDVAAKDAVVKKSWDYLKRAHLHGGAIGAAAIGSILALILLCRLGMLAKLSALAFGSGAFIYSLFWLFAGLAAPGLGSTKRCQKRPFRLLRFRGQVFASWVYVARLSL